MSAPGSFQAPATCSDHQQAYSEAPAASSQTGQVQQASRRQTPECEDMRGKVLDQMAMRHFVF